MGTLTGTNYDTDVRAILGAVSTDLLPTATLLRFTNAAYLDDICAALDLPDLDLLTYKTTTSGTDYIQFPTTEILTVKGIVDNNGIPLKEISANDYDRLLSRTGSITGVPTRWYQTRNPYIYAYPIYVTFSGGTPSSAATATATATDGAITAITVTMVGRDTTAHQP